MKILKFEGTAEEFAVASRLFEDHPSAESDGTPGPTPTPDQEVSARKAAYKSMLNRIPIDNGQQDLYRVLSGGELEFTEYCHRMNRSARQIAGVHGALGKRINKTEGFLESGLPENMSAIASWRRDGKTWYLSLKPEFIEVLVEEGII